MPNKIELTGQRFGRLVVLEPAGNSRTGFTRWRCQCDCGNTTTTYTNSLRQGGVKSCGCILKERHIERAKNKASDSNLYKAWAQMIQRCCNEKNDAYENYGGRGIAVCERWLTFRNFQADMGERPVGMTLDRRDNNGNYEPGNCRWATWDVQSNNKRTTLFIECDGETLSSTEWAKRLNTSTTVISHRFKKFGTPHPIKEARGRYLRKTTNEDAKSNLVEC